MIIFRIKKITSGNLFIEFRNCSRPVYPVKAIPTSSNARYAQIRIWQTGDALVALCPFPCVRNACETHINKHHFTISNSGLVLFIGLHLCEKLGFTCLFNITRMKAYVKLYAFKKFSRFTTN